VGGVREGGIELDIAQVRSRSAQKECILFQKDDKFSAMHGGESKLKRSEKRKKNWEVRGWGADHRKTGNCPTTAERATESKGEKKGSGREWGTHRREQAWGDNVSKEDVRKSSGGR